MRFLSLVAFLLRYDDDILIGVQTKCHGSTNGTKSTSRQHNSASNCKNLAWRE